MRPYISRGTRNSRLKPHCLFTLPLLFVVSGLDLAGMESVLKVSVLTEEERREAQSIGLSIAPEALILQSLALPCSLIHGCLNLSEAYLFCFNGRNTSGTPSFVLTRRKSSIRSSAGGTASLSWQPEAVNLSGMWNPFLCFILQNGFLRFSISSILIVLNF